MTFCSHIKDLGGKGEKVKNEIKTKAIVLAICIVVLVALSALASAGEKPENLADGVTDDMSSTENDTIIVQGWGVPKLEITAKSVEPTVIAPGGTGMLDLTITEVWGYDWAKDTNVSVEILDPDGCVFLETGNSQAHKYLGRINEYGSLKTSFTLRAADSPAGKKAIRITVKYWEMGAGDFFTYGPYYEYASIDFDVNNPTVSISTGDYSVHRNRNFTVNISLDPTVPIQGLQSDLSFDSTLVSVVSVTEGNLLTQGGASTYFSQGDIDNAKGTITGMSGIILEGGPVSTPGIFATIQMTSKNDAGTSSLSLSNVKTTNIESKSEPTLVNDGRVTVWPYDDCDVNEDGCCDIYDLSYVVNHFGEIGSPGWIRDDTNRDGNINVLDIIVIYQHWTG